MRNKLLLAGIFLLFFTETFGQNIHLDFGYYHNREIPELTKNQMKSDFNELYYYMKNLMPLNSFYKQAGIMDIDTVFNHYRNELDTITNMMEFYRIIDEILLIYNDGHLWADMNGAFISPNTLLSNPLIKADSLSIENTRTFLSTRGLIWTNVHFRMKLKYIDGRYYNVLPFVYNKDTIFNGAELLKINGEEINSFISQKNNYTTGMKWDTKKHRYYSEYFFLSNYVASLDSIEITYKNIDKIITQKYSIKTKLSFIRNNNIKISRKESNLISYIEETHTLVIRLATLTHVKDDILDSIKNCFITKDISNIIFDVRGDKGGKDIVWEKVVSLVIGPYKHVEDICGLNTDVYKKHLEYLIKVDSLDFNIKRFSYLEGSYACYEFVRALPKLDTSFFYEGPIYIFTDDKVFSGTYNFLNFMTAFDNVTTIGTRSGYIYYAGNQPMDFMLSYSKIIIKTPINFCSNKRNLNNIFYEPDYSINENIQYVYTYYTIPDNDYYSFDILKNNDVYFKKFMEIVKSVNK